METITDFRANSEMDPKKIKPTRDNILVKVLPTRKALVAGLEIVSVGPSYERVGLWVEVIGVGRLANQNGLFNPDLRKGDVVYIKGSSGRWCGEEDGDGVSYRMIKPDEALGRMEKANA